MTQNQLNKDIPEFIYTTTIIEIFINKNAEYFELYWN